MMNLYILPTTRAPLPDGVDLLALEGVHKAAEDSFDTATDAPTSVIAGAIRASTSAALAVPEASGLSFSDPRVEDTEEPADVGSFSLAAAPLLDKLKPNFDTLARFGYNEPTDPENTGLQSLLRRLVRQL